MLSESYSCPVFGVNNTWLSTPPPERKYSETHLNGNRLGTKQSSGTKGFLFKGVIYMGFSRFWSSTGYTSTHMSVFLFIVTHLFIVTPTRVTETDCVDLVECELYEYTYVIVSIYSNISIYSYAHTSNRDGVCGSGRVRVIRVRLHL